MKTTNKPGQIEYEHVALILKEANTHGLHWEVDDYAKKLINRSPEINIVEAYQLAYEEWVK
ncbi:MAG: hypothetical protein CMP57_02025 [Flavobacteriales bacterium]|nr:hypothetical protein [Flavobacteriales bacterium]|tara:strand:- start:377 stop:559 length:183 start_codon:yes stop_codon:yes gene_type:complete